MLRSQPDLAAAPAVAVIAAITAHISAIASFNALARSLNCFARARNAFLPSAWTTFAIRFVACSSAIRAAVCSVGVSTPTSADLFNVLAMVAEFESDLIRMRTREGMNVARAKGHLKGKQRKLTVNQARHLLELDGLGTYSTAEMAELFGVSRSTIYRRSSASDRPQPTHTGRSPRLRLKA